MNTIYDVGNLVITAILVACLIDRYAKAVGWFLLYALIIVTLLYFEKGSIADSSPNLKLITLGVAASLAVLYISGSGVRRAKYELKDVNFKYLNVNIGDHRFVLLIWVWLLTLLFTTTAGYLMLRDVNYVSRDFFVSWAVNVVFFSVVGLAVAVVSLRVPQSEEFKDRIGFLFAAKVDADPELKNAALEYLTNDIKKIGFVSSHTERKVTVVEYSEAHEAYRAYVTVKTTLVNLFGDVEAVDETNFKIQPDVFEDGKCPVVIGQVVSLVVGGEEKIKTGPLPIDRINGIEFKELFSIGREEKSFTWKYWAWFKTDQEAAYTSRRFCRSFNLHIVNRIKEEAAAPVTIHKLHDNNQLPAVLRYNEKENIQEIRNMEPGVSYPLFKFAKVM